MSHFRPTGKIKQVFWDEAYSHHDEKLDEGDYGERDSHYTT
jgi:hypothetical protein